VQLLQLRLVVIELELTGPTRHEQVNHALGLARHVRRLRRQRIHERRRRRGVELSVLKERRQGHRADAEAAIVEEVTARLLQEVDGVHSIEITRNAQYWQSFSRGSSM
jgi:hypothetical protein